MRFLPRSVVAPILLAMATLSFAPAARSAMAAEPSLSSGGAAGTLAARLQADKLNRAVAVYRSGRMVRAAQLFGELARAGVPAAQHDLAVMHLRGELPGANAQMARRWLEQAAAQGFVTAQMALGELYESRLLGTPDLAESLRWYRRAADAGSVDAQVATATAYFLGRGTAADSAEAVHWFRLAANGGDIGAQYILASMYEKGDGVATDLRLARYWYAAAARQGDEAAPAKVVELDTRLASATDAAVEGTGPASGPKDSRWSIRERP